MLEYHRQLLKDFLVPGQSSGKQGEALLDHTACVMNCIWFYGFPKSCPRRRFFSSFCKGVSAILVYVFPHPVDPGQGDICQKGKQLPEAVTRVQSWLVQFGIVGLLLTSFIRDPLFLFFFSISYLKFSSTLLCFFIIAATGFAPLLWYWRCRKASSSKATSLTLLKHLRK